VSLSVETPARPLLLFFDDDLLDKALGNLLANALRFTPRGGQVVVSVGTDAPVAADDLPVEGFALLRVRDDGPGVAQELQERVFERFFQGEGAEASQHQGAGIGLSLAREVVELHGGDIHLVSTPGEGPTFTIRLPFGTAHLQPADIDVSQPPPPESGQPALAPAGSERPAALVVEDHLDMRAYLADQLGAWFSVSTAAEGAAALELVSSAPPAVVVSDVMMPGVDGLELARRLRAEPATAAIPILLVSAKTDEAARVEGLSLADDYVTKPFSARELVARVRRLASRRTGEPSTQPPPPASPRSRVDAAFLRKLDRVIWKNLAVEGFNVAALAKAMAVSRRKLQREVHRLTGETPLVWLRSRRLARARDLLLRGECATVAEAAAAVGLSQSYFYRIYACELGHSPSDDLHRG